MKTFHLFRRAANLQPLAARLNPLQQVHPLDHTPTARAGHPLDDVDIGDGQSVENDLSTCSASMLNIARILRGAGRNTLVLLDELGAGTDPREGAALGIEIVRGLVDKGAIILATTHLGELKFFAGEDENIENGAMEFDNEKLEPTYRLRVGMPGRSFGLQIARRSGLPETVIKKADLRRSGADAGVDELLDQVDHHLAGLKEEKETQTRIRRDLDDQLKSVEKREHEIISREDQADRLLTGGIEKMLSEMRKDLERTVKEVREAGKKLTKDQIHRARKKIASAGKLKTPAGGMGIERSSLGSPYPRAGDNIYLPDYDMTAKVIRVDRIRNRLKVERKGVVLDLPVERVFVRGAASAENAELTEYGCPGSGTEPTEWPRKSRPAVVKTEMTAYPARLDVRGKTVEDAWIDVERAIDTAIMDGYNELVVIHGKGTGRLRAGLTERLLSDQRVRGVKLAESAAGGEGVSIVSI